MSTAYRFPDRLRALQLQVHRVRTQYEAMGRELPWSVEATGGWSSTTKTYSPLGDRITAFPASPGWTTEQIGQYARLRRRLVRLSAAVITHPWWSSRPTGEQVVARMALKRMEAPPAGAGGEPGIADEAA
ncbi:hypothetical protein [Streptomyces lunaelactis]|uniref:hypothetical protein n=1 Tax=Streptomyces lunaelactis TaxID=1535768 RepID=UPI0015852E01|nr:hypothetical protein [Streptomyces lunaelactis]NUK01119.1 hypothetical protein [Streptomyces lunaelactis]NUK16863.1 hypothetical protein [Streptomyces lunaelactis]